MPPDCPVRKTSGAVIQQSLVGDNHLTSLFAMGRTGASKPTSSPRITSDHFDFAYAVAVSGETVVVSAPGDRSSATGVNGSQNDDGWTSAGAAHVLTGFAPPGGEG